MSLYRELAEHLRAQILSGELPVGAPLPSEAKLCTLWGTSRGPVRQALAALRAEGLIGGGRGAPPVVRSRQLTQSFDTFLSFSRWAEKTGRKPGQRTFEVSRLPASSDTADALGIDPGDPIVRILRLRLLDGEPTMLERASFPWEYGALLLTADLDGNSIYQLLADADVQPVSAHHVIDAIAADDVDAAHLGVAVGSPLLRERRHAALSNGDVLEYGDDRYRPDCVTFTILNALESPPALSRTWSNHGQ